MSAPRGAAALAAFRLDDTELVQAGDPGGLLRQIASSAAQVRTSLRACDEADLSSLGPDRRPRAIVVVAAGASAFAGEVLAAITWSGAPVQVMAVAGYQLPGWVGAADLVIGVSASGTGEEALALAEQATRRGCELAGIGPAGSALAGLVTQARGVFVPVPSAGTARASLWSLTVPLLRVASLLGVVRIPDDAYEGAAALLEEVAHQCRPSSESFVNPAKSLALDLAGTLPLIWGGSPLASVAARRFAALLASSAKYPAVAGVLPGIAHDQVSVLDGPFVPAPAPMFPEAEDFGSEPEDASLPEEEVLASAEPRLVLIADAPGEHSSVTRMRTAAAELATARGIGLSELTMDGDDPLRRLASVTALLDYTSAYLAIACGIDPLSTAASGDLRDLTEQTG